MRVPSPDLVRPPVLGLNAPPIAAFTVKVVAPMVWTMTSRASVVPVAVLPLVPVPPMEAVPMPLPPELIVASTVERMPPLSRATLRNALRVRPPALLMVRELIAVEVSVVAAAPAVTLAKLIRLLLAATIVPLATGVLISVEVFSARRPIVPPAASNTPKLAPLPPTVVSTMIMGAMARATLALVTTPPMTTEPAAEAAVAATVAGRAPTMRFVVVAPWVVPKFAPRTKPVEPAARVTVPAPVVVRVTLALLLVRVTRL